jgi:iron complex outermembrane receptor protein
MHTRRARAFIFLSILLPFQFVYLARAQQDHPNVTGLVEDPAGRAIVAASVTVEGTSGRIVASAHTDSNGRFSLPPLSAAEYQLIVDSAGFAPLRKSISIGASPVDLTLQLAVAAGRETITVTAPAAYTATDAVAAAKVDIPIMETPIAVAVVPAQVLADQQSVNLIDALTNVSGVAPTNDGYGTSDSFSIRGFDAASLLYQDGMRLDEYSDSGFPQDMANVESIEIVKGPASVLYGQGEPGGLVNVVTKKPHPGRFGTVEQQFGNHQFYRTTADLNEPIVGTKFLTRVAFDGTDAGSFRNFVHTNEFNLYPSVTWQPRSLASLTLRFEYQKGSDYLDNGIPFVSSSVSDGEIVAIGSPAKVPYSSNFIDTGSNKTTTTQFVARPELTLHLAENWPLRLEYKYFYVDAPTPLDEVYTGDADSSGNLSRFGFTEGYFHHRTSQVLADLPGKFTLGAIKNTFLIGFDFSKDFGAYDYNTVFPALINIYAPDYNQPIPPADPAGLGFNTLGYIAYGGYIQDLAEFPGHVFVLGGVRRNWAESFEDYSGSYVATTDVHEHPTNPRAGLLWQPRDNISLYSSYSSNYGDSALGSNAPGQKFLPPQSADQTEFGVKSEWLERRLTATAAIYRILKHNVPAPDPSNPALTIAIGTARTQGIEFDLAGQISSSLRVIGSYSNFQAITTSDTNSIATSGIPSQKGLPFGSTPHFTESIWGTWEPETGLLRGFRLGAGLNGHSGEQAYQTAYDVNYNPLGFESDRISSTAVTSVMSGYERAWGRARLSAQINIENLFNRRYFANVNPAQGMPGAPITILPALQARF